MPRRGADSQDASAKQRRADRETTPVSAGCEMCFGLRGKEAWLMRCGHDLTQSRLGFRLELQPEAVLFGTAPVSVTGGGRIWAAYGVESIVCHSFVEGKVRWA